MTWLLSTGSTLNFPSFTSCCRYHISLKVFWKLWFCLVMHCFTCKKLEVGLEQLDNTTHL
jgi:hypothetical protein